MSTSTKRHYTKWSLAAAATVALMGTSSIAYADQGETTIGRTIYVFAIGDGRDLDGEMGVLPRALQARIGQQIHELLT
jgi:hypothetical protein